MRIRRSLLTVITLKGWATPKTAKYLKQKPWTSQSKTFKEDSSLLLIIRYEKKPHPSYGKRVMFVLKSSSQESVGSRDQNSGDTLLGTHHFTPPDHGSHHRHCLTAKRSCYFCESFSESFRALFILSPRITALHIRHSLIACFYMLFPGFLSLR